MVWIGRADGEIVDRGIGGRANLVWELVVKRRREERTWPKESVDVENQIVTGGEVVPVRRC